MRGVKTPILKGTRYGKLIVLREGIPDKNNNRTVVCKCKCGTIKTVRLMSLKSSNPTRSCGCLAVKKTVERSTKHGLYHNPLYKIWKGIKQRCYDNNSPDYGYYGGRGIKVCKSWRNDPKAFIEWAQENGWQPNLQIDRKDNNLGYRPTNCRFVTNLVNMNNRRPRSEWKNA